MIGKLAAGLSFLTLIILSSACTTTEKSYSKTIGSSSASEAKANRHNANRDKSKEAAETYVQLGLGYLGKGERQQARFNFTKALEKDGTSSGAHNGIALLFQLEGENALAEEHFHKAINYDPELTRVRNNYGIFLFNQKRYEDAAEQFSIAAQDLNYARRGQVFFRIGLIAREFSKPDESKKAFEKAAQLSPKYAAPFLELADIYYREGDYPKAKRYLDHYELLSKPSPRGLWLAVRLERVFANKDGEASKALALEKMFPYSQEYLEYQVWLKVQ